MKQIVLALLMATFLISPDSLRADNFSLGGMAISRPLYEGSDESEIDLLPIIDISIGKWGFLNVDRGLGVYFLKDRELELGGGIGYYESRKEEDSAKCHCPVDRFGKPLFQTTRTLSPFSRQ